jgi:serine protease Do
MGVRHCVSGIKLTIACCLLPVALHAAAPDSFAPLAEKLSPAVVNIATTQKIKGMAGNPMMPFMFGLPDDPGLAPFKELFRRFGQMPGHAGKVPEREVNSLGSGFIIDASGYVVTNNHVIDEADEVKVIMQDDTKLDAKIVGRDEKTDLALLKVTSKKPLPFVSFGNSDTAKVGDWIIAIGNPFGLGGSVSAGIISARSRSINAGPFDDFIQTDAAINRGNSGGPMFNMAGEVIGVNSAIISPSGGNVGIGFAVPSNLAQPVIEQLKKFGRTHRGWLGVKIQEVTEEIAESIGLPKPQGALVLGLNEGSPAKKAGIRIGDVITHFNGNEVGQMRKLPRIVAETKVGTTVPVKLWRDGKPMVAKVTLGEQKEDALRPAKLSRAEETEDMKTAVFLGLQVVTLDSAIAARFGIPEQMKGLLVLEVDPVSIAARQGLQEGDVITHVNNVPTATIQDFRTAMGRALGAGRKVALVRIQRSENDVVFVTLPSNLE